MRKVHQEITDPSILETILGQSHICRIGMIDRDGLPYVLPFNYGYKDRSLYIHCALAGKKIDLLRLNPKVCFEIEDSARIVKDEVACKWATAYRSIIGYGTVSILTDLSQKQKGLELIMNHNGWEGPLVLDPKKVDSVLILQLHIESMTGKQSSNWEEVNHPGSFQLETERLTLTEITIHDLEFIHQLHSMPGVDEFNTLGIPETPEDTRKIIMPLIDGQRKIPRNAYTWIIILKETDESIGLAGMFLSNDKFKLGEIYYKFHPDHWGMGYATETAKCLIRAGFEHFDLQKVEAGVATENDRSIKVLEKTGMTREGLRRQILPIRGEWKDNYHYAIVKSDERDY